MGVADTDRAVGKPALVVRSDSPDEWFVSSSPIPLVVVRVFLRGDLWYYQVSSDVLTGAVAVPQLRQKRLLRDREAYFHDALQVAGDHVTRLARYRWMAHFTGKQRYAMGQQKCPFVLGQRCCDSVPLVGSVWCEWHRFGKEIAR